MLKLKSVVDMSNIKKHNLLALFYNNYVEETNKGFTKDMSKALSIDNIIYDVKWSNKELPELESYIEQLKILNFLSVVEQKSKVGWHQELYVITNEGKIAYHDRVLLNKLWWKDVRFWLPLTVSIIGALLSLGIAVYKIPKEDRILKLEQRLDKVEKVLHHKK